jgi:hypothetical protein
MVLAVSDIRNYVVIRFSVRHGDWAQRAYGDESNRAAWFEMRSKLFLKWTAASLQSQTIAPRRVFVVMDPSDTQLWARHLALPPPFTPVYLTGGIDRETFRLIREDGDGPAVTSRIDSDDAVAPDYLERINESVGESWTGNRPETYVVACNGYVTDLASIETIYWNASPFLSIFTPEVTEAKLLTLNHLTVLDHAPILNTTALWMQIVHGTNLANKLRAPRLRPPDGPRVQLPGSPLPAPLAWPLGFLHLHDPRTAPPSPGHGG